jgi:septum formation protein
MTTRAAAGMIILASQSPRRAELLAQMGVDFRMQPAQVDETVHADERAADYVERVAIAKARTAHAAFPDLPVLGSDTAVVLDQAILGKPGSRDDAIRMLMSLSGRPHEVLTGVAVVTNEATHYRLNVSRVFFRDLSEQEAAAYWATGEPADKAGAYAVQGLAAAFIERIEGSYSGIMGLPLFETMQMLGDIGVPSGLPV